jgi:hypothetical protein
VQPRERALTTPAWLALGAVAAVILGGGAVAGLDVVLHPEETETVERLGGGDLLVRSHLDRWIGGQRHELRRLRGEEIVASIPDWPTNIVALEHGFVVIHRSERITLHDEHLAPVLELSPAPGMHVIHTMRWLEPGRSVWVWSRPLDMSRPNALEVWDVLGPALLFRETFPGGAVVQEWIPPTLVARHARPPTIHAITREGLVPLVPEPATSVCAFSDGVAWTREDGTLGARLREGPTITLEHSSPGRPIDRCMRCDAELVVVLEDHALWNYDAPGLRDGVDSAAHAHAIVFDLASGSRLAARSSGGGIHPSCADGHVAWGG